MRPYGVGEESRLCGLKGEPLIHRKRSPFPSMGRLFKVSLRLKAGRRGRRPLRGAVGRRLWEALMFAQTLGSLREGAPPQAVEESAL